MSSASVRLAALLALSFGCAPRQLGVTLAVDAGTCALTLPAPSSLLYQMTSTVSGADAGSGSFCGACLAVNAPLSGTDALIALVRQTAPSCAGVPPNTLLGVRIIAFNAPGCPLTQAPAFCIEGPTLLVPDGTSDGNLSLMLACHMQCAGGCTPTTCQQQSVNCGQISDGCNNILQCGDCIPPEHCGGAGNHGTPNVCS
jgi:hypothetical protein